MLHIWFLAANVLYWISLYATATIDPGYLPRNAAAYDEAIKQVLMCLSVDVVDFGICSLSN